MAVRPSETIKKERTLRDYIAAHADVRQLMKGRKRRRGAVVSLYVVINISIHKQARKYHARFYSKESDR